MLEEEILRKPDLAQDKLLARMRKVGFRAPLSFGERSRRPESRVQGRARTPCQHRGAPAGQAQQWCGREWVVPDVTACWRTQTRVWVLLAPGCRWRMMSMSGIHVHMTGNWGQHI